MRGAALIGFSGQQTVWNPADVSATGVISGDGKTFTASSAAAFVRGTNGRSAGHWYYEMEVAALTSYPFVGLATAAHPLSTGVGTGVLSAFSENNPRTFNNGIGPPLAGNASIIPSRFGIDIDFATMTGGMRVIGDARQTFDVSRWAAAGLIYPFAGAVPGSFATLMTNANEFLGAPPSGSLPWG